jgi:nicotinate-nucleotide adenylyltransferase
LRIGILGGSFNPAHEGHLHITMLALKHLELDQVWWMVSPQNPLKSEEDMAPLADRMSSAETIAGKNTRILVTDIETRLNTRYTSSTLRALLTAFPYTRFIWLMGADNLQQIPRWEKWTFIFRMVPIAIFDRATYSFKALASKAAHRFQRYRVRPRNAASIVGKSPPAWVYFHSTLHPASGTEIRASRHKKSGAKSNKTSNSNKTLRGKK